MLPQTS